MRLQSPPRLADHEAGGPSPANPFSPIFYHYTSIEAFRAIVRTARLRATHYMDLDDKHEIRLGAAKLLKGVANYKADASARDFKAYLQSGIEAFTTSRLKVYVLSLTDAVDSIPHWSRYARKGVAIGFDRQRVVEGFQSDEPRPIGAPGIDRDPSNRLMRCRYAGSFDLPSLVAERFFGKNSYVDMFNNPFVRASQFLYATLAVSIYQVICTIKRGRFVDEKESRVVHLNPDRDRYRVRRDKTNRSFIRMRFDPLEYIREVWIGPHDHQVVCRNAATRAIKAGVLRCDLKTSAHCR